LGRYGPGTRGGHYSSELFVAVQRPGGKIEWLKPKRPEHVVQEYWIFCWLGPNAYSKQLPIFDRIVACSRQLGSLAIVWRRYAAERKEVGEFRAKYLIGPVTIPIEEWNAHLHLLEQVVVDTEAFFWFANRLLTNVALTLNYFFKKVRKISITKGERFKSHATFVDSDMFRQLPTELQAMAVQLNKEVAGFRNERIEHDIDFWRRPPTTSIHQLGMSAAPEAAMHLEWSDRPLSQIWISLHDYLTDVSKFIGPEI
jgi:hypothetical protein